MKIKNIRHIGIPTSDMESALTFWESAGFSVDTSGSEVINGRKINWVKMTNAQGYCIEILDGGSFHIAFTVDKLIEEHYINLAPSGHRIQFGQGPDGIGLEFVEEA